jgi:two-component system cell cycle sensor histidine kinase/response regulator CckA
VAEQTTVKAGTTERAGRKNAPPRARQTPDAPSEAQLADLVHRWPGIVFSQRADFSFDSVHGKIEELTGLTPAAWLKPPNRFWEIVHEADEEQLKAQCQQAAAAPEGIATTYRVRHAVTGKVSYVLEHRRAVLDAAGAVSGYTGAWRDITRQTIAEKRLVTMAWKETLAALTMGLAHDFNNMLSGILSLTELMMVKRGPDDPDARSLGLIKQTTLQASQLLQRIVNLHRGKTGAREYLDLNQLVPEIVELLRKVIPRNIRVETDLPAGAFPVFMDGVGFRQVVLNLALNAADAVSRDGRLVFRASAHTTSRQLTHCHGKFPRLPCVCLSVEDNGSGIAARHLPHLFDPFFTTKPLTKGSGLGLYNAAVFADQHEGAISVDSTEGAGATFHLWLPQADFSEAERFAAQTAERPRRLLLVGQPGAAMDATAEFLRTHNFRIFTTHTPARAIELLATDDAPVHGVMVVAGPGDAALLGLVPELRERRLADHIVLQMLGGNTDDLDGRIHKSASVVLASNTEERVLLDKLRGLCASAPSA